MKVKYISDDGHEFSSKTYCEHYENALEEIEQIDSLPSKLINSTRWFRISSVADFYFFDHMSDTPEAKSGNTMYDIAQICSNIDHRFPFWITKDLDGGGIMIDKKRHQMIDGIIDSLENEIEKLKREKNELSRLRSSDLEDEELEYKSETEMDQRKPKKDSKMVNENEKIEDSDNIRLKPFMDINGEKKQLTELMKITMEESEYDEDEWSNLSNKERNNLTKQKIKELRNK